MINSQRDRSGFTIIELLIAIAIIGVLALAVIPSLLRARNEAQVRSLQVHSKNVQTAAVAWLASNSDRTSADAVAAWSPCLTALSIDGYATPPAPAPATECTVAPAPGGRVDAIVVGDINGTIMTFINGGIQ